MKFIIALLLSVSFALIPLSAVNIINPYVFVASGPPTYDFKEAFETPTTGYENASWSPTGTIDPASTTLPLQGAQSCAIVAGDILRAYTGATGGATQYGFCLMKITTLSSGFLFVKWFDSGFGTAFQIELNVNKLKIYHGGTGSSDGSVTIATATLYYLWYDYTPGSGANGVAHVYVSTTATKPGSADCTITNGSATADVAYIRYAHNIAGSFDYIVMNATAVGSNPF